MFARRLSVPVLLLGAALDASAGDSMRCGARLVSVEARAAEILAACGEPDFREIFSDFHAPAAGEIADAEQWTYNFGSSKLLHVLRLRNGRLTDIATDGYGFTPGPARRCTGSAIVPGLSKYRLLASCGEPLTRRTLGYVDALRPRSTHRHGGWSMSRGQVPVEVFREEWVYNLGSRYFMRIVTLENGVVAEVQNGERGSDRP